MKISQNFGAFSEYMNFTGQFLEKQLCNLTPSMLSHLKLVRKGQNCPPILKFDNYLPIIEKIREILNLTFPPLLSHFASFCLRQNTCRKKLVEYNQNNKPNFERKCQILDYKRIFSDFKQRNRSI